MTITPSETTTRTVLVARGAFDEFFDATWPDLVGFCTTLTGRPHLGEELAQEALTRVCLRFAALREPRPYAFKVAANLVKTTWRAEQRSLPLLVDDYVPPHDGSTLDAVRRLDRRLRDVVLLHYYADLPIDEVARALKRPAGTVKRRLHEARARLAETLGDLS